MTGLPTGRSGERGVALLLSLLLLTSLTLLGLAAASDASLQNRMVGNLEKNLTATRHAESAGRWAEAWLLGLDGDQRPNPCSDRCGPGQVIRQSGTYPALPERESEDWWRFSGFAAGLDPVSGDVVDTAFAARGGYWIVEEVRFEPAAQQETPLPDTSYYRIVARGTGPEEHSVAVVESIVARPWGDAGWSDNLPRPPDQPSFCRSIGIEAPCGRLAWQQRR
jgi:Tfp pilus assembly protein PilX